MATLLHLPFNVDNGLSVPIDYSPYRRPFSLDGAGTITTTRSKYGNASFRSTTWGDGLTAAHNGVFDFGTGDFTIEFWIYDFLGGLGSFKPNLGDTRSAENAAGWFVGRDTTYSPYLSFQCVAYLSSTVRTYSSGTGPAQNVWEHWAFVRQSGTLRIFRNGSVVATHADVTWDIRGATGSFRVGGGVLGGKLEAHLDDYRISDVALYTDTFTPPGAVEYEQRTLVTRKTVDTIGLRGHEPPAAAARYEAAERGAYDHWYAGRGRISATTEIKGSPNMPVSRRVRLHEQITGNFVKETWSDAAGNYTFDYIDPSRRYYAVAFDHTGAYQGVVADQLVPEVF